MAAPQTTILARQAFGNSGDFWDNSPRRVMSYTLESTDQTQNVFARVFTHVSGSEGIVQVGANGDATNIFAGYLVNNKEHVLHGTAGGSLAPSNYVFNGENASICNMGLIFAKIPTTADIGWFITYDLTTGELFANAPGSALPVGQAYGYASVERFIPIEQDPIDSLYLCVIKITETPQLPS